MVVNNIITIIITLTSRNKMTIIFYSSGFQLVSACHVVPINLTGKKKYIYISHCSILQFCSLLLFVDCLIFLSQFIRSLYYDEIYLRKVLLWYMRSFLPATQFIYIQNLYLSHEENVFTQHIAVVCALICAWHLFYFHGTTTRDPRK